MIEGTGFGLTDEGWVLWAWVMGLWAAVQVLHRTGKELPERTRGEESPIAERSVQLSGTTKSTARLIAKRSLLSKYRAKTRTHAFGIVVWLLAAAAAPEAAAVRDGPPITVEVSSLQEFRAAVERATPGSVIRLAPGIFAMSADDPLVTVKGLQGLPDRPIVIQGTRGAGGSRPTIVDGGRSLDGMLGMVERFRQPSGRTPSSTR